MATAPPPLIISRARTSSRAASLRCSASIFGSSRFNDSPIVRHAPTPHFSRARARSTTASGGNACCGLLRAVADGKAWERVYSACDGSRVRSAVAKHSTDSFVVIACGKVLKASYDEAVLVANPTDHVTYRRFPTGCLWCSAHVATDQRGSTKA